MFAAMSITFVVIYVLEAAVIIIGNTFTIFVFSTRASHLKRTCFLLINLAVADLLVGITCPIVLGTENFYRMTSVGSGRESVTNPSSAFQLLGSSTSVLFLALVSLERAFAVLWPLRHRVASTRVYVYSIVIVWTVGFCMFGLFLLSIYHTKVEWKYVFVTIHSCLLISLLVICASYLKIRTRLSSPAPGKLHSHSRQSTEHNLRLSRTIFIVIAVSLLCWLPAFVVYTTRDFCQQCFSPTVVWFMNALHIANSMVNPFVYSFRMPIFKNALKNFLGKRRQNIKIRSVQSGTLALNWKRSFTPKMSHTGRTLAIELTRHVERQADKTSADGGYQLKLCAENEDRHNNPSSSQIPVLSMHQSGSGGAELGNRRRCLSEPSQLFSIRTYFSPGLLALLY